MKKMSTILSLMFISLTLHAGMNPIEATYCSKTGSSLIVEHTATKKSTQLAGLKLTLHKSDRVFVLLSQIGTTTQGGQREIGELKNVLITKGLLKDETITTYSSFAISTLLSKESSIRALHVLIEAELDSGERLGILETNGTFVFVGKLGSCSSQM